MIYTSQNSTSTLKTLDSFLNKLVVNQKSNI
jgi:hypothetical protein